MKVLHLTSHLKTGGITLYIYRLSRALRDLGIQISVAASDGEWASDLKKYDISVHLLPLTTKSELSSKLWRSFFKLKKLYASEKWDVIHAHTRVTQCLAHVLSSHLNIPYITTWHGYFKTHLGRRIFPCLGERTIAISHPVESYLSSTYPKQKNRIVTIQHGILGERYHPDAVSQEEKEKFKREIGLKPLPIIGNIARLSYEKGHIYLLDVLKYLLDQKKIEVQLLIVGEGRQEKAILNRIQELGLQDWVYMLPFRKDAQVAMACLDIFASYHVAPEGFGFSLLEAMAMGKPVVSRHLKGGISDFLEDGKCGYLLKEATIEEFSEKIYELLTHPKLRREMGQQGSHKVVTQFSHHRMVEKTLAVYHEVLR